MDRPTVGLPMFWKWMDGDAPPGFDALNVDGLHWAENRNRSSEYAVLCDGRGWFSLAEALDRRWIRESESVS